MTTLAIHNGRVIDPALGRDGIADVVIVDGRIARVGPNEGDMVVEAERIDATGLIVTPGFVDLHTHLREPGREDAETVLTGSQAAALGGFTCVHAMANTTPVADTAGVLEQVWHLGLTAGLVDVRPVGAVTIGLGGERMAEIGAMAHSAAAVRVFSDDGKCVFDPLVMRRALEYSQNFGAVIAQHAPPLAPEPADFSGALLQPAMNAAVPTPVSAADRRNARRPIPRLDSVRAQ